MDCKKLDEALTNVVEEFRGNIVAQYGDGSNPTTEGDLTEVAKQTFYTLNNFKDEIIKFLKSQ